MPHVEEDAEELAFRRLYGDWRALDPAGTAAFMADYPGELRDHATAPWFLDCILSEDVDGQWLSRRDPEHVRPEVVLHHKARLLRPKDTADLLATWPLLAPEVQAWLRDAVRKERADHPWLTETMGE